MNRLSTRSGGGEPVLQVRNVSKAIRKRRIVDGLSFEIGRGEIVGLLGPNGAGKTTTIRMLTGLIAMTEGDVLIHGHSLRHNFRKAISGIGAIIENPEFYPYMTGLDNMKQYLRMTDGTGLQRVDEVIKLVGLTDAMDKKVKAYSLGMRQRLGIAQALLHRPGLLILDEPTNGLDPAGIREMRQYLRQIADKEGISILISSHLLSEIEQICGRAVVIQNGKLVTVASIGDTGEQDNVRLTFRVNLAKSAARILGGVAGMELLGGGETEGDGEVVLALKDEQVPEAVAALAAGGVGIYRIVEDKGNLEEHFLKWTEGNNIA